MGLVYNDNYMVYEWLNSDCKILFSITRQGNAIACHFASDKKGLRHLMQAFAEFEEFLYNTFDWCEMFLAIIERPSVCRLVEKYGFSKLANATDVQIYMKVNNNG